MEAIRGQRPGKLVISMPPLQIFSGQSKQAGYRCRFSQTQVISRQTNRSSSGFDRVSRTLVNWSGCEATELKPTTHLRVQKAASPVIMRTKGEPHTGCRTAGRKTNADPMLKSQIRKASVITQARCRSFSGVVLRSLSDKPTMQIKSRRRKIVRYCRPHHAN